MAHSEGYMEFIWPIILYELESGMSLREVLRHKDMPSRPTVYSWVDSNPAMADQYTRATKIRADMLVEEIIEIADSPLEGVVTEINDGKTKVTRSDMLGHRRTQIDTRKWAASKMNPKKYGDKLDLSSEDGTMTPIIYQNVSKQFPDKK